MIAILTAVFARRDCPCLEIVVPVGGNGEVLALVVDFVGSRIWVPDRDQSTDGARRTIEGELLLLRRCASVLNRVVSGVVDECGESLLSLLASVGTVPDVVHVGVEPVVEAASLVLDVKWLC